jgi:apolipoprotein N-acyltransferase
MLRSTNSGISALIDEKGRVRERSPLFVPYVLSGDVVPMKGMTPYLRFGNRLVVALALAALGAAALIARRQRPISVLP